MYNRYTLILVCIAQFRCHSRSVLSGISTLVRSVPTDIIGEGVGDYYLFPFISGRER